MKIKKITRKRQISKIRILPDDFYNLERYRRLSDSYHSDNLKIDIEPFNLHSRKRDEVLTPKMAKKRENT